MRERERHGKTAMTGTGGRERGVVGQTEGMSKYTENKGKGQKKINGYTRKSYTHCIIF